MLLLHRLAITRAGAGVACLHHLKDKHLLMVAMTNNARHHQQQHLQPRTLPAAILSSSMRLTTTSHNMKQTDESKQQQIDPNRNELKGRFIDDDPKMPPKERIKNLVKAYGPVAVVLHIVLSLTFLGVTYLVILYGFDMPALLIKLGAFSEDYMRIIANGGTFGLAYALYKSMMPLRALVTIALTPIVSRRLQVLGLIKKRVGT